MPYYGYCILRLQAEREWKVFPGIDERPVFPVREGRLAMLVSRVDPGFIPDAHSLIQHGRVVHRAFAQHTVLPFRFGTTFAGEHQVRQLLIANRTELQDGLNRLRGKPEMHVKMLFPAEPCLSDAPADSGKHEQHFRLLACERLAGLFQPLGEHVSVRRLQNGEWLVDFAHLIEESGVGTYQQVFGDAAERLKDCQLLVSGPWPPYHFLPSAVRMPPASELRLRPGRRVTQRRAAPPIQVQAAKA